MMPECRCRKCGKQFDAPLKAKHRLLCGDARSRESQRCDHIASLCQPEEVRRSERLPTDFARPIRGVVPGCCGEHHRSPGSGWIVLLECQRACRRWPAESVRKGFDTGPRSAVGLAVCGRVVLEKIRQWRAGRRAEQV